MIREANIYDIPRIYELGNLLQSNFSKVYNLNEMLEDKITKVIVYEEDNKVVGFLTATNLIETCDILSIMVDESYRRHGVASNLFSYLLGELSPNLKMITLEVASKNTPAFSLYKKLGFEIVNVRKNYYKDDDAYLMVRKCE